MNRIDCRAAVVISNTRRILMGCLLALTCSAAGATSTIVDKLTLPGTYFQTAVDPVLHKAFVIHEETNSLKAIDLDAMQVVGSIPLDADAAWTRVDVARHRVYILHVGVPGRITTIDGKTLAVIARTTIVERPIYFVADFRRGELYAIHDEPGHHVTIFDTKTNTVAATLQLPQYVYGLTVNRQTGKIYVPLYGSRQVAVISQASRTVVKTIAVNMNPVGAIAEERNGSVFITGFQNLTATVVDQLAVIDSETDTVRTTMTSLVSLPNVARFDPVPSPVYARAYVSNPDQGKVTVIDAGPSTFPKAITIPGIPIVAHVNEDDGEVYVVDRTPGATTMTILDARLERIAGTLDLGFRGATVSRVGGRLLITGGDAAGNTVFARATPQGIQPDTVIATDFHHEGFDHFFHSANRDETRVLQDGVFGQDWLPTQQFWRVWKTPRSDRVPVCRLFSTTFGAKSSHFYTPYASECDSLKAGSTWQYEETSYYVVLPDANGGCSPAYEELYRLYNNGMGGAPNHAYTNNRAKRDALQAKGWVPEGSGPQNVFACTPPLKGFVTSPP